MDFGLALEILRARLSPPVGLVIGGYRADSPATFTSQGEHPHQRMFAFRDNAFVLIGWPLVSVINGISERPLDRLRREMNDANIWHFYHQSSIDIDNDLHLVLGHVNVSPKADIEAAVRDVRTYLESQPYYVEIGEAQASIVATDTTSLASANFIGGLSSDPAEIAALYR